MGMDGSLLQDPPPHLEVTTATHPFQMMHSWTRLPSPKAGQKGMVESLWREFFSDPSQWCDYRSEKRNVRYPDFKHQLLRKSLWINSKSNPPWVKAKLAGIAPGTVPVNNIFPWNARLGYYVKAGEYVKTIQLFQHMLQEGMMLNTFTCVPVLNACANLQVLEEGRRVHAQILQSACHSDSFLGTGLVQMYAKCGSIEDAWKVFNKMPERNLVAWNIMLLGYVRCAQGRKTLELFQQFRQEGLAPDARTFVAVLNACASMKALEEGRCIHELIVQTGCETNAFVGNSLVDMYTKCESIEDAWCVFKKMPSSDVVAWTTMILGYVKCGQGQKALVVFGQMQQEGLTPDPVTYVGALNACASVVALEDGRRIHEQIIRNGCHNDVFVGNSLIDMYSKCESIGDARLVFNKMSRRDVVTWIAMILGYGNCGKAKEALDLFRQMQRHGVDPNRVTFVCLLNACASVAALEEGRRVHKKIVQNGCASDVFVASSLVDMYAKCGSLEDAQRVFNNVTTSDVTFWTAMLEGYFIHGLVSESLGHFKKMCEARITMDAITFIPLLSACSHGGLVDEGLHYFDSLNTMHGIPATVEHFVCMVDLLVRAGRLQEAEDVIKMMPCAPDASIWLSLLGSCRVHGNVEMGERVAKKAIELDPSNAAGYVLLCNLYATVGKLDSIANLQHQRLERRMKRQLSRTWIEVNNELHTFTADDQEHPQIMEIYTELR